MQHSVQSRVSAIFSVQIAIDFQHSFAYFSTGATVSQDPRTAYAHYEAISIYIYMRNISKPWVSYDTLSQRILWIPYIIWDTQNTYIASFPAAA